MIFSSVAPVEGKIRNNVWKLEEGEFWAQNKA